MADNEQKRGKPDRDRVDPKDPDEVRRVAKKAGVPPAVAKKVAAKAGPMRKNVEAALARLKKSR